MKVLLINPPTGIYLREDRCQAPVRSMIAQGARPPMDLAYIAATCREAAGAECRIRDYPVEGGDWNTLEAELENFRPDVLVISTTTPTFKLDMEAAERAHRILGDSVICIGKGAHFAHHDEEALLQHPELDLAIRGESELVIAELISGRDPAEVSGVSLLSGDGSLIRTPDRLPPENLDSLPFPARDLLKNELYSDPETGTPLTPVLTSRGCPGNCVFCPVFLVSGKRLRTRSVASIIGELESCVRDYGIHSFLFRSDTFTMNRKWVLELCEEIHRAGLDIRWGANSRADTFDSEMAAEMASAGCHVVSFGVESGDPEILAEIGKDITLEKVHSVVQACRSNGIMSLLYFVIGFPWDTRKTIRKTVRFARSVPADFYEFHAAYPFPGTPMYDMALRDGLFKEEDLAKGDYFTPIMNTYSLSCSEVAKLRKRAILGTYLSPAFIIRTLGRIRSASQLWHYISFGFTKLAALSGWGGKK
ncbi:MAG: radical SAM protein [Candidatus Fermentibacteria bacterium]